MTAAQVSPPQDEVTLTSGEVLKGELIHEGVDGVVLKHPVLGDVTLKPGEYTKLKSRLTPVSPWKSFVNGSVSGVQSTNDTLDARLAGGTEYQRDEWLFRIGAEWYYRSNNGDAQDNNVLATQLLQRTLDDTTWSVFQKAQYEYDEFQSWNQRYSLWGGAGYELLKGDPLEATVRIGAGASREEGTNDDWYPNLLAEITGRWAIDDAQRMTWGVEYIPDLTQFSEFIVIASVDYVWDIPQLEKVSLVAGIREQWDTNSRDGTARNELRYYLGLQFNF